MYWFSLSLFAMEDPVFDIGFNKNNNKFSPSSFSMQMNEKP